MLRTARFWLIILLITLAASLLANVWLWRTADGYYRQINRMHLNPLGLVAFPAAESDQRPLVVFYGDSRAEAWPAPAALSDIQFVNRAIGGQTSAQVLGRFQTDVTPLQADILVLQVGINDLKTLALFPEDGDAIMQQCLANITAIIDAAHANGTLVILTTIIPAGELSFTRSLYWSPATDAAVAHLNDQLRTLSGPRTLILDAAMLLSDPAGQTRDEYRLDSLHLNEQGYRVLNQALVELLATVERCRC